MATQEQFSILVEQGGRGSQRQSRWHSSGWYGMGPEWHYSSIEANIVVGIVVVVVGGSSMGREGRIRAAATALCHSAAQLQERGIGVVEAFPSH